MVSLQPLQQFSRAGSASHPNEDGAGFSGRLAWIIDGATGVSDRQVTSGASDASWLSSLIASTLSGGLSPEIDAFQSLERVLSEEFRKFDPELSEPTAHSAPSACLGLIEVARLSTGGMGLKGRFLGDVVALVPTPEGILRWTDERAKPFERLTLASLGDTQSSKISDVTRQQIIENRQKLNQAGGYWIVHPVRPWAGQELTFEAEIVPGMPVMLATDGFMRLVDVFKRYKDESLYAALAAGEAERLLAELRELESHQDSMSTFRRVKIHDDATVIVLSTQDA